MSERIKSVIKDTSGEITEYVLSNGETVSKHEGVEMAKRGEIEGVIISHSKKGEGYLRTKGDGIEGNNLSEMDSE
ncbi:DUF3892 domain-containing protein [Clostridium tarantellae]|uniref:DUF3892 domain-containing protein n=1 Tax=Clostridium tarantellae TaxID=39493 RepID=A0A6I1MIW2_9CLOT|nr:DUF3892 domain-containing protein [Clostridium tarantellae]MPQ43476.1 DUF3892 domain-containing protein [Clostridium tarantellae]